MKTIDFTKPGGFPLTQDQLGYLQQGYSECINALAQVGGSGPIVISGCHIIKVLVSGTVYNYSIAAGWVFYQGSMVRVPAGSLSAVDTAVNDVYLQLTATAAPLTYNDGSIPNVIKDVTCSLTALTTGAADDAAHFALSSLQPYGREATENVLTVNTLPAVGGVSGFIYYRKNFLNNTLQIRGVMGATAAQNFATSSSSIPYLLTTLPAGYLPRVPAYFTGEVIFFTGVRIKDDLGISWIDRIVLGVDSNSGNVFAYFKKPEIAIATYPLSFNCIISLD